MVTDLSYGQGPGHLLPSNGDVFGALKAAVEGCDKKNGSRQMDELGVERPRDAAAFLEEALSEYHDFEVTRIPGFGCELLFKLNGRWFIANVGLPPAAMIADLDE